MERACTPKVNIKIDKPTHLRLDSVRSDMQLRKNKTLGFSQTLDCLIELYEAQVSIQIPDPSAQVSPDQLKLLAPE